MLTGQSGLLLRHVSFLAVQHYEKEITRLSSLLSLFVFVNTVFLGV